MGFDPRDLDAAVTRGLLTREQADGLLRELPTAPPHPEPGATTLARELAGALAAIVGCALFGAALVEAHGRIGGAGLALVAAGGAVGAAASARGLWRRHRFSAGGAVAMIAALLAPIAAFGLLDALGLWSAAQLPWHDLAPWAGGAFWVAVVAVTAATLAFDVFPFPPLAAQVVAAAWFTAQAAAPLFFGPHPGWPQRALLSVAVGLVALVAGAVVDGHVRRGLPDWIYAAGLVAFRGGVAGLGGEGGGPVAAHLLVDAALLAAALLLRRPILAFGAALGATATLGGLAESSGITGVGVGAGFGVAVTAAAEGYRRHRAALEDRAARLLAALLRRVPSGRRGL